MTTDLRAPSHPLGGHAPTEPVGVATHCAYCGLQCAMTLTGTSAADLTAVSYTHLTLPTICSV